MRLGVIGGSSLVTFDPKDEFAAIGLKIVESCEVESTNSYGTVKLRKYELAGDGASHTIFFMNRHCHPTGGITPPHKINHHANMRAFYDQKVDAIVSTTSVGTIHANFPPGRVGVTRQYIDFSGVATTYHEVARTPCRTLHIRAPPPPAAPRRPPPTPHLPRRSTPSSPPSRSPSAQSSTPSCSLRCGACRSARRPQTRSHAHRPSLPLSTPHPSPPPFPRRTSRPR